MTKRKKLSIADFEARLDELRALDHGWLDGTSGEPLPARALAELGGILLELHVQEDLPLPYVYPTPEGGLEAEWSLGPWEVSAIFDLRTKEAVLDAVHRETGAGEEATTDLESSTGRKELERFITSFSRRGRAHHTPS